MLSHSQDLIYIYITYRRLMCKATTIEKKNKINHENYANFSTITLTVYVIILKFLSKNLLISDYNNNNN